MPLILFCIACDVIQVLRIYLLNVSWFFEILAYKLLFYLTNPRLFLLFLLAPFFLQIEPFAPR